MFFGALKGGKIVIVPRTARLLCMPRQVNLKFEMCIKICVFIILEQNFFLKKKEQFCVHFNIALSAHFSPLEKALMIRICLLCSISAINFFCNRFCSRINTIKFSYVLRDQHRQVIFKKKFISVLKK